MTDKEKILAILMNSEAARCDDLILYADLIKYIDMPEEIKRILIYCFYNHITLQLPNFHTVIRARRAIQKVHPELTNKTAVEERRAEERRFRLEYGNKRR